MCSGGHSWHSLWSWRWHPIILLQMLWGVSCHVLLKCSNARPCGTSPFSHSHIWWQLLHCAASLVVDSLKWSQTNDFFLGLGCKAPELSTELSVAIGLKLWDTAPVDMADGPVLDLVPTGAVSRVVWKYDEDTRNIYNLGHNLELHKMWLLSTESTLKNAYC